VYEDLVVKASACKCGGYEGGEDENMTEENVDISRSVAGVRVG
jgi:hypothetical protein